ncbi:uncharacterized protein LOC122067377 [Macadamia integrifolia]|uniref:uncharacterized protein LOC122067377 n=1 Tax=Macadamia integrifolia TaxID=60698 RepID=UPI001C4EDD4A|nr:uncharacterized protein LOC122067377 [Macadamia integrifolia]
MEVLNMSSQINYATLTKDYILTGPNYVDWRRNIKLLLTAEGLIYVIEDEKPSLPDTMEGEEKAAYELFRQNNSKAKLLVLNSIDNTIKDSIKNLSFAKDMLEELKKLYEKQNRHAHILHSTKMTSWISIIDHVMKLHNLFQELEAIGTSFKLNYKTDVILYSLPQEICGSFICNYNMNKIFVEFPELGNMLQEVEAAHKL